MKTKIEIHNENENESGVFKVWAKVNGLRTCVSASQQEIQSLLSRSQEEDFFLQDRNKFTFMVPYYNVKKFFESPSNYYKGMY